VSDNQTVINIFIRINCTGLFSVIYLQDKIKLRVMKNFLFISLFSILCTIPIQAQQFFYGPKIGGNLSHFMYEGDNTNLFDTKKMMLASHIGAFVEVEVNDVFAVQTELLYSIKGARFALDTENDFEAAYIYKYLSLPVLAKYYVTQRVNLQLGPQFGYLLSARNVEKSKVFSSNLGNEKASINIRETMKVYDIGVVAGVGYVTKYGFYLAARYNFGLANIYKNEPDISNVLKNGSIQLTVGFSLR